jgi:hypothetical protein
VTTCHFVLSAALRSFFLHPACSADEILLCFSAQPHVASKCSIVVKWSPKHQKISHMQCVAAIMLRCASLWFGGATYVADSWLACQASAASSVKPAAGAKNIHSIIHLSALHMGSALLASFQPKTHL